MYSSHFCRLCLPLVLSGLLVLACSSSAPNPTKSEAPEKTGSEATPAALPASADSTPIATPPARPAEKPHKNDQKKTGAAASVSPQSAAPQVTPPSPEPQPVPVSPAPPAASQQPVTPPPAPIPVVDTKEVVVTAGTQITILMIDSIDSRTGNIGDTFRASIESPVTIDNDVVFQQGADAYVKLLEVSSAGGLRGKSELQLALDRITVGKKSYTVETNV